MLILLIVVFGLFQLIQRQPQSPEQDVTVLITKNREDGIPGLAIKLAGDESQISVVKNSLIPELRVALSRYRTVELVTNTEPDIELHIRQNGQTESIIAELVAKDSEKIEKDHQRAATRDAHRARHARAGKAQQPESTCISHLSVCWRMLLRRVALRL